MICVAAQPVNIGHYREPTDVYRTDYALETSAVDEDYDEVWSGFPKAEVLGSD